MADNISAVMEDTSPTPAPAESADPLLPTVPPAEWVMSEFASWLCLGAGILVMALTLLIPEMIRNQQTAHQLRVLELQKDRSEKTLERHQSMLLALEYDDPALLEHLALTQLRLKPVGSRPLTPPTSDPAGSATSVTNLQNYVSGRASADAVENWLNPILPKAQDIVPQYRPPPTRLVQWTTEWPYRDFSLFTGIVLMALGLWPKKRER